MFKKLDLLGRAIRIAWGNPRIIGSLARAEYRRRIGIPRDRRVQPARIGLPVNLGINLTRRCNLDCAMCIQHRGESGGVADGLSWYDSQKELPLVVWLKLLDQAIAFRPTLYVTGGEPMLYREFAEFVIEARKRRLFLQIATNGTLLAHHAELLAGQGAVTAFHLVEHLPLTVLLDVLAETWRVLRPGGPLIVETPNPDNMLVGACNFHMDPTHRSPLPNRLTAFLLRHSGFTCVQVLPLHPHDATHRVGDADSPLAQRFNDYFHGPQDYAVIGLKPPAVA